jgi:hypothetical protein
VVAVDDSEASVRALVWAFGKAKDLGVRVEALTAWPLHGPVFVREVAGHFCEPRWRAREVQAAAVARALALVDNAPPYEMRVVNADLVGALTRAGARSVLVVVGVDGPHWSSRSGRRLVERLRDGGVDHVVVVGTDGAEQGAAPPTAGPGRRSR